jgi:hypothetical protein
VSETKTKTKRSKRRITDAQRRARIQPILNYWTRYLRLVPSWSISFRFTKQISPINHVFAEITTNAPYCRAMIAFARSHVDAAPRRELELVILHELMHLVLMPVQAPKDTLLGGNNWLADQLMDGIERTADQLAILFLFLKYGPVATVPYQDQNVVGRP